MKTSYKTKFEDILWSFYSKYLRKGAIRKAIRYTFSRLFCGDDDIPKQSDIPIEVCLVTVQKDFETLKLCLESIRKFVMHPITKISIVSKKSELITEFCNSNDCLFIDEISVLGYGFEKFHHIGEEKLIGREGWFYQQLLKFGFAKNCQQEHYLVVDTDTIFLKPRIFKFGDITIFDTSDEWHIPYRKAYKKLIGLEPTAKKSFVAHCMLFEKKVLNELKSYIEEIHKIQWDDAIIKTAEYTHKSFFSEYETYGNFFLHFYRNRAKLVYWFNHEDRNYMNIKSPFWAKSLSCHAHIRARYCKK